MDEVSTPCYADRYKRQVEIWLLGTLSCTVNLGEQFLACMKHINSLRNEQSNTNLMVRPAQVLTSGPQLTTVMVEDSMTVLTYWAMATPTMAPRPTMMVEKRILKMNVGLNLRF